MKKFKTKKKQCKILELKDHKALKIINISDGNLKRNKKKENSSRKTN